MAPAAAALAAVIGGFVAIPSAADGVDISPAKHNAALPTPAVALSSCPWLAAAVARHESPTTLAALVVSRMSLSEKLGEIALRGSGPYENVNSGVARLCIPSLTLQDGPSGLAYGDRGVTQLPAPLGLAASFDPSLAGHYGQLLAEEAKGQGIDVVQAPNLNIDRIPQSGQGFTGFGEDPLLVSTMGDAEINGIQSQGVMADAKHLAVYSQEADRLVLNNSVSQRALEEIYFAPFKAAVDSGVASLMCAYPRLNGSFECQSASLAQSLKQWGFAGFVRSDQGAVHDPAAALRAGTDLLKPGSVSTLVADIKRGSLSIKTVNSAVERVLAAMFAYGLIGHPERGAPGTRVDTAGHAAFALQTAERSLVLLRNQNGTLPLDRLSLHSIAVIGAAASDVPTTGGHGSSQVIPPFVSTPLAALKSALGAATAIRYVDGGSTTGVLPVIPTSDLTPLSGPGHGLDVTVSTPAAGTVPLVSKVDPVPAATLSLTASPAPSAGGTPALTSSVGGASLPSHGVHITLRPGARRSTVTMSGYLEVPRSGLYSLSVTASGPTMLSLDQRVVIDDSVGQGMGTWSGTAYLVGGHRYGIQLKWVPFPTNNGATSRVEVGMSDVTNAIQAAASAAKKSQIAVVFAADYSGEMYDRPTLDLPGDQNALISAVAAANPHTIVVLNTSGPLLMPWLKQVGAVLEAWYPGEQDGLAVTAALLGSSDPSGHLPVTFPSSQAASATSTEAQWPGTGLLSSYSEGLAVGYRYDHQDGVSPLFPFGFGLSYTSFSFGHLSVSPGPDAVSLSVQVTNTGHRAGGDTVQAYLTFPAAAGEPPGQLVGFSPVTLAPGDSTRVNLKIPRNRFGVYLPTGWMVVPGQYSLGVGDSSASQPLHSSFRYR